MNGSGEPVNLTDSEVDLINSMYHHNLPSKVATKRLFEYMLERLTRAERRLSELEGKGKDSDDPFTEPIFTSANPREVAQLP